MCLCFVVVAVLFLGLLFSFSIFFSIFKFIFVYLNSLVSQLFFGLSEKWYFVIRGSQVYSVIFIHMHATAHTHTHTHAHTHIKREITKHPSKKKFEIIQSVSSM